MKLLSISCAVLVISSVCQVASAQNNQSGTSANRVVNYGSNSSTKSSSTSLPTMSTSEASAIVASQRKNAGDARILKSLTTFMVAANKAVRLEQLYPYAGAATVKWWQEMKPQEKRDYLIELKKWTSCSRVSFEDHQPLAATVRIKGPSKVDGASLFLEGGYWKFNNIIMK